MRYIPLEKLHALYDGYRRRVRVAGRELLLLQEDGQVYALVNRCPHMNAPLHTATISNRILRCPMHGIEFDLRSGKVVGNALGCVAPLEILPLIYEGNTLGIAAD